MVYLDGTCTGKEHVVSITFFAVYPHAWSWSTHVHASIVTLAYNPAAGRHVTAASPATYALLQ